MCVCVRVRVRACMRVCVRIYALSFLQNYDTSESKLRREMEAYGPVKRVRQGSELYFWIWM